MNRREEVVVIGGGPAGLAAALAAREGGVRDILIIEREETLGGILNQCIHNGFGLHTFKEELTGPEYADRYCRQVEEQGINCLLHTMVVDIRTDGEQKTILAMNGEEGMITVEAKAVILAMGCRERSRGALNIPGFRPAGVYSAGTAQRYVNIDGRMPGKEVVILGSGDIGLIMARRMTLEGAKVKLVAELLPYSGGLKRNIVQCLDDFGIPLLLSHTVIDIAGKDRVEGVTIAKVDENRRPIPGTESYVPCDTLLLSCGLIPENELSKGLGVTLHPVTAGPVVDETLETNIPGVFACGNVLHVHDLVDFVSMEAKAAGIHAAAYVKEEHAQGQAVKEQPIAIEAIQGVRYTVPAYLHRNAMEKEQTVRFRVGKEYRNAFLVVLFQDQVIIKQKKPHLAPGEMEQFILKKDMFDNSLKEGVIKVMIAEEGM